MAELIINRKDRTEFGISNVIEYVIDRKIEVLNIINNRGVSVKIPLREILSIDIFSKGGIKYYETENDEIVKETVKFD